MNAKKCKKIRKVMRANGQAWNEVNYKPTTFYTKILPVQHQIVNPIHLSAECGRKLYKGAKGLMA